jgi:hypothetical protein
MSASKYERAEQPLQERRAQHDQNYEQVDDEMPAWRYISVARDP